MPDTPEQRLLLVHAHPDDESINNGATMARYVEEGRGVTLVTCTAGEMGEVLVPDLAYLAADQEDGLGAHRRGELDAAMQVLGVTDHRFLGGFGAYRDSGMKWHEDGHAIAADPENGHENAFWHADLTAAADHLVEVIREVRPQVLVTYDQFGGYGHPDHIQAHRVAMYAATLAGVPSYRNDLGEPWEIAKIYWTAMSESRMRASLRRLRDSGDTETFAGHGARRRPAAVHHPRRADLGAGRRAGLRGAQAGRAGRAPHPGRGRTGRSSAAARAGTRSGARSTTASSAVGRSPGPTASRTTCSRGCDRAAASPWRSRCSWPSARRPRWRRRRPRALVGTAAGRRGGRGAPSSAVGRGWLTRLPFALGYVGVVLVAIGTRPEGDFVVASSARGYLLLLLTLLVLVVAVVTLPRPAARSGFGSGGGHDLAWRA